MIHKSEPEKHDSGVKVWCDGCYDLVHYGHANSLRQAKAYGDYLIVGVHSDEEIMKHKGPPVFTFEERCRLVESIKWVDKVVKASPYVTSLEMMDVNSCNFCCHGDDITVTEEGVDTYKGIKEAGRYKEVKRTIGISTTSLVNRILTKTKKNKQVENTHQKSPWTGFSNLLLTGHKISQFCEGRQPKESDKVVYVVGSFDLFHVGHLHFLEKARSYGDFLIVGLYPDALIRQLKGSIYPVLTLHERLMVLLACKYVSDVVIDAPYSVTQTLMDHLKVDVVVDGSISCNNKAFDDPFKYPKEVNKFIAVNSGSDITTDGIVERIIKNRLEYEARNEKKEQKEIELFNELKKTEQLQLQSN